MKVKYTLITALLVSISFLSEAQSKKPIPQGKKKEGKIMISSPVTVLNSPMPSTKFQNEMDSLSYGIGVNIGQNLKQQGMEGLNLDLLKNALNDVFRGNQLAISQDAIMPLLMNSFKKVQEKKFAGNKIEGAKVLAENKKKPGVITLPSGLQYEIMKKGEGAIPKATDKVKVHYHGTTTNGKVFDSSVDRGTPAEFGVTQVIAGWVEALQLMPVGSKWKLTIPENLAYGERGAGENIPPFSTLVFEVEILEIVTAK